MNRKGGGETEQTEERERVNRKEEELESKQKE